MTVRFQALFLSTLVAMVALPGGGMAQNGFASHGLRLTEGNRPDGQDWKSDPEYQALWQNIQQARQANIRRLLAILDEAQATLAAERTQSQPNFAAVTHRTEAAIDELIGEMRQNRDRYLALYEQLDPAEQAQAQEELANGLNRLRRILGLLTLGFGDE